MNAISYSLFTAGHDEPQSLEFRSYLRGLELNLRVAEVLYPGWQVVVICDNYTFGSRYGELLKEHARNKKIDLWTFERAELCKMMLWRLHPVFAVHQRYDRVLCRDTDSLLSMREREAVEYWVNGGRVVHCITDSISHTIALMGGMIGVMSREFRQLTACKTWEHMLALANPPIDYTVKGSDQDFLNRHILPRVAHTMTEHYVKGMPQSFREDCIMYGIASVPVEGVDTERCRALDGYGFHIGAAGFQVDNVVKWLGADAYYDGVERRYPEVFYWHA